MEVETDKTTVEIEAPASGILANVTAAAGDEIPVTQVIAAILAAGESAKGTRSDASTVARGLSGQRPRGVAAGGKDGCRA